jgi:O-antigen/teichoic acid export membrane protein
MDPAMRAHFSNAAYGVLDYMAYPAGMLVVAPIAVRNLGAAQFGVWMIANAALSIGSIMASGFGDANIRYVSMARGGNDQARLSGAVRSTMGIHILLGATIALISWTLAPAAAARIASSNAELRIECLWCLRVASLLILVRAVETVCVSTQRAFERYGAAVRISVIARLLALASAAVLPLAKQGVVSVMIATAIFITVSLGMQLVQLKRLLGAHSLWPSFDRETTHALLGFGIFSWIQAVSGILFGQVDRLITGIYLGAAAVASYALCAQMAQPIYGIAASGLHFLFPYVSARVTEGSVKPLRRTVLLAFGANFLLVAFCTAMLLVLGTRLLTLWGGVAIARAGGSVLPLLVWSTAAQALSVTGTYTMLALGRVRLVTFLNLAGGAAMLLAARWLLPKYGMHGMAMARLFCGPFTLLVYIPLAAMLFRKTRILSRTTTVVTVCEEISQ